MATYSTTSRFQSDFAKLTRDHKDAFRAAVKKFVHDLESGAGFRKGLRVKGIKGAEGIFELTWADNGRATFEYGKPVMPRQVHVVWRRCGTHDIFQDP